MAWWAPAAAAISRAPPGRKRITPSLRASAGPTPRERASWVAPRTNAMDLLPWRGRSTGAGVGAQADQGAHIQGDYHEAD